MNDYTGHHNRTITYDAGEYVSHPTGHALTISTVTAEQILDSRGNPTVRVSLRLDDGFEAVASAPAGASTGAFEAVELPRRRLRIRRPGRAGRGHRRANRDRPAPDAPFVQHDQ